MPRSKKSTGCVISLVLTSLLLVSGLVVFVGLAQLGQPNQWLFNLTGEEALLPQIKGLSDLAAGAMRPRLQTADMAPIAHAGVNPFGVNVFLEQEVDPAKREQVVRMASEAGFHWLRQEFPWEDIEIHGKGDFEDRRNEPARSAWEKYDHIVDLAETYDLELIVRLSNPPTWSRADGDARGTFAPPDNLNDYGDFVAAVVERYKGRVHTYQIWNEPNIYPEWGEMPVSPERYTELLKIAATRAREIDPTVTIVSGALASTIDLDGISVPGRNFNDLAYLQRMYDAGAAPYFDVLAMQGYGLWSGPTDRRMNPRVINFSRPRFVRDVMVRNGDAAKPIWISEMNWNAVPDEIADKRYGQVTPEQQAAYLPMAYERLQREWPWLGVANTWFLKRATDEWEQQGQPQAYFRLLTADFQPEPVYTAMQTVHRRVGSNALQRVSPGRSLGTPVQRRLGDRQRCGGGRRPGQAHGRSPGRAGFRHARQRPDPGGAQGAGNGPMDRRDRRPRACPHQPGCTGGAAGPTSDHRPQPAGRSAASRRPAARGRCIWSDRRPGGSGRLYRPEPQHGVGQRAVLPGDADLPGGDRLHFLFLAGE